MTDARATGVVVDTMVISWLFDDRPNPLADQYRQHIGSQPVLLAFQTVMELRFGALRAGWGELRRRRLERRIAEIAVVQPDDALITACAELRMRCQQSGHALGNKLHDDRWIAATAIRLGVPLVSTTACSKTHPDYKSSPPPTLRSTSNRDDLARLGDRVAVDLARSRQSRRRRGQPGCRRRRSRSVQGAGTGSMGKATSRRSGTTGSRRHSHHGV